MREVERSIILVRTKSIKQTLTFSVYVLFEVELYLSR